MLPLGCATASSTDPGGEETVEVPTVTWVSPRDGDTVEAGDLPLSVAVEDFVLVDAAKVEGHGAEGTLRLSWTDGATSDTLDTASTTPTIALPSAGAWTLSATLVLEDGDEATEIFPEFTPATIGITAVIAAE
jgi:hypothetical protein